MLKERVLKYRIILLLPIVLLIGCVPKIQLETPKEGITINVNVDVKHKIDVVMDKQAQEILSNGN